MRKTATANHNQSPFSRRQGHVGKWCQQAPWSIARKALDLGSNIRVKPVFAVRMHQIVRVRGDNTVCVLHDMDMPDIGIYTDA